MINIILRIIAIWLILGVIHMLILYSSIRVQGKVFKEDVKCFLTLSLCVFAWPLCDAGFIYGVYTELTGKAIEKLENLVDESENIILEDEDS